MAAAGVMLGASTSSFSGRGLALRSDAAAPAPARAAVVSVEAKRVCQLTGKKRNKANVVTFSNKHNRKWQEPNLQHKKVFWETGKRWVKLRICTKAIKSIEKNGLEAMAAEAGIDLWKLPFEDARPARKQYLADNAGKVPVAANPRAMRNAAKLAASTKQPRYPVYEQGGRIVWIKPGMEELVFGAPAAAAGGAAEEAPAELKITAISGGLTQRDVDEVIATCKGAWSQPEVESLYKRFRSLDRGRKGYISAEELMGIPELSINPLAQRLVRQFESVNFLDFARLLAAFSDRAAYEDKVRFIFRAYDVDGDGLVTRDDLQIMLRQLAGSSLSDDDIGGLVSRALAEAGSPGGLTLQAFRDTLAPADLGGMVVSVPTELACGTACTRCAKPAKGGRAACVAGAAGVFACDVRCNKGFSRAVVNGSPTCQKATCGPACARATGLLFRGKALQSARDQLADYSGLQARAKRVRDMGGRGSGRGGSGGPRRRGELLEAVCGAGAAEACDGYMDALLFAILPPAYDANDTAATLGGRAFVGPAQDQRACSSCVPFAATAAAEAAVNTYLGQDWTQLGLSEQDLAFCRLGRPLNCATGMSFDDLAADVTAGRLDARGWARRACLAYNPNAVGDRCFRSTGVNPVCQSALPAGQRFSIRALNSVARMKHHILTRGGVVTSMVVQPEFKVFAPTSAQQVYTAPSLPPSTDLWSQEWHAIMCYGWDDAAGAWLCKNSWGPAWGWRGTARVAYGSAYIMSNGDTLGLDFGPSMAEAELARVASVLKDFEGRVSEAGPEAPGCALYAPARPTRLAHVWSQLTVLQNAARPETADADALLEELVADNVGELGAGLGSATAGPLRVCGAARELATGANQTTRMQPLLSLGVFHSCAVTPGGGVRCWGDQWYKAAANCSAAGSCHKCTGAYACWSDPPAGLAGVTALFPTGYVSAYSSYATCAASSSAGLVCWPASIATAKVPPELRDPALAADVVGVHFVDRATSDGRALAGACAGITGRGARPSRIVCWGDVWDPAGDPATLREATGIPGEVLGDDLASFQEGYGDPYVSGCEVVAVTGDGSMLCLDFGSATGAPWALVNPPLLLSGQRDPDWQGLIDTQAGAVWASNVAAVAMSTTTCRLNLTGSLLCYAVVYGKESPQNSPAGRALAMIERASGVVAFAAGGYLACVLELGNRLGACAGHVYIEVDPFRVLPMAVPPELVGERVLSLAVGPMNHACVVRADRRVACWGQPEDVRAAAGDLSCLFPSLSDPKVVVPADLARAV
ncbi:CNB1 [Scenedesmus sp. PABB004]|nr:CNB1 [Scenedesmus sp. PABB004]